MDKENKLPVIKYGTIPRVLLLGNGINKAFGKVSWDNLLEQITTVELDEKDIRKVKKIPYPLQPIVLTDDQVDVQLANISDKLMATDMEEEQKQLIKQIATSGFDAVLTTNYTYEIERAIDEAFPTKKTATSKFRKSSQKGNRAEEELGIYKYISLGEGDDETRVWHIHGEAARPKSMVLGHYYYGKLLEKIQQYVSDVFRRYNACNKAGRDYQPKSWIDYFLIGNVYVVGFGMDMSEMDIWWLINCKKRNITNHSKIFYYEANMQKKKSLEKKLLAQAYGVQIITRDVGKKHYKDYYNEIAREFNIQDI